MHMPAWVMDHFALFCSGYGSCFMNLPGCGSALRRFAVVIDHC